MRYIFEYLEKYGMFDFSQKPFNEIDNIIFSQLAYTDFGGIVEDKKILLYDAAIKFYSLYSDEQIGNLIGISEKSARLLSQCAKTRRFGWVQLGGYVNSVDDDIDKQFSAICFYLNSDDIVIAFRGTDVTVTGTKESAMLSYMFPVPAQIEALHYFQETAMLSKGEIRICGHSKGGNLAVFAGVNCSNSLKKRIVGIYEDDAPGFPKYFFERYDYKQIKDKINFYAPQSSIIGRMLYHDVKPKIVLSENSGLKQHQVYSWIIEDDHFITQAEFDGLSNFVGEYVNTLIDYVGEDDLEVFLDMIEAVLTKMGIQDFYDLKAFDIKKALIHIDSLSNLDKSQKERFKYILRKVSTDFAKEFISSKAKDYTKKAKTYTQRAKSYLEKFKQPEKMEEFISDYV